MTGPTIGGADAALDQRLSDELDRFDLRDRGGRSRLHARVRHLLHLPSPLFYGRLGYEEIFRWESVPTPGRDDVHLRKELPGRAVDAGVHGPD